MRILGTAVFLYIFFLIPPISPITEKEILLQFKANISNDPFGSLNNWDPTQNPCQHYTGISCNSLGNVEKIVLWNTSLDGVLSPALSQLKSLRIITLFGNRFVGNIPLEYGQIQTLWKINLSSNALSGSIPEFLGDLPSLRFLDLSRNGYSGEIPSALFRYCYRTRFVSLGRNVLTGPIPVSIGNCRNLEGIDLSYNALSGELPSELCDIPGITYVSVRRNALTGNAKGHFSKCARLEFLDLGSNNFTGSAPFEVITGGNIEYLNISGNKFEGEVSDTEACSKTLEFLDASRNDLSGEIPARIDECSGVKYLDLGFNRLNGSIPVAIGGLKKLLVVKLGSNSIEGTIPAQFGDVELLQVLDLHNLELTGEIPDEIAKCRFLLGLDVSGNSLSGTIPEQFDNMTYLVILDLSQNQLSGTIPVTIGALSNLKYLDFSDNSLSGTIPTTLGNLNNLTHFNVSYNNLSGTIPERIRHFGFSAFQHNSGLCGTPLLNSCSARSTRKSKLSASAIIAIVAASLIVTGVCVITVINMKFRRRRQEDEAVIVESTPLASTESDAIIGKLVLFNKSIPSKHEDWEAGTEALLGTESLIGGGSIGTVYKTTIGGDIPLAVKKIQTLGSIKNQDEFEQEIGHLGSLHHPNLVRIQGYYWSSGTQLILYEYIPKGNLYDNLHGPSDPSTSSGLDGSSNPELTWPRRFQATVAIAKALAYLHHDCKPPVLHLNVKPSNILLDEDYTAKVCDYGFRKLLPLRNRYGLPNVHTAVGYMAPELAQGSRASDKCDVYSFGVVVLELVTGRKAVERLAANEVIILCEHVKGAMETGKATDVLDKSMLGVASENEVIQVMRLGLICCAEMPSRRPSMAEVVQVLESIGNGVES